jgi:uncharacterized protein (TIGR03437 family)
MKRCSLVLKRLSLIVGTAAICLLACFAWVALHSPLTGEISPLKLLNLTSIVSAQETRQGIPDNKGTDFWLTFPANQATVNQPELTLFITGETNATGNVSISGLEFSQNFSVTAGTVTPVVLPRAADLGDAPADFNVVRNRAIHVTATSEVAVYGLNRIMQTTDAYLGLPTDILGQEYLIQTYRANGPQFAIAATRNETAVTITLTQTIGSRAAGQPFTITMNQGDAYQLRGTTDLSGTLITSTQPIAVFSGNRCANVPPEVGFCDTLVEQVPPIETWGTSFLTAPLATRLRGDTFRFLAKENGTTVTINGQSVATLNRGQTHEQLIDVGAQVRSNSPILVTQFSNGTQFDGVTSDPFMMIIPPFEQFQASYTVTTPATGFRSNFVTIVVPNDTTASTLLDGQPLPANQFTPIGNSGFSYARPSVTLGSHRLSGPRPFGVFVYGYDSFDSYGYPGGMSLGRIGVINTLTLAPLSASGDIGLSHCLTSTVTDPAGLPVGGVRVDFAVTGPNATNGFGVTGPDGLASFCYTGRNPGLDTIRASVGELTATATKTWTGGGNGGGGEGGGGEGGGGNGGEGGGGGPCDPQAPIVVSGNEQGFDFGVVPAGRTPSPTPPSRSFTVENKGCAPLQLSLALQRTGAEAGGKIVNLDDGALFPVRVVGPGGALTPVNVAPGAAPQVIPVGGRATFVVQFNPLLPILAGKTDGLFANQVLPDVVTSRLVITPNAGAAVSIGLTGRIATAAQMIDPGDSSMPPLTLFTRSGNDFLVECSTHDSNLDLYLARYQFLDQNNRPVGEPADVDLVGPIQQQRLARGQSFTIAQQFVGVSGFSQIAKVRVTLYDRETNVTPDPGVLGAARPTLTSVSAASFKPAALASESIVSMFGADLGDTTQPAAGAPLPTTLGGVSIRVRDGSGEERLAPLFYASRGQVNYQIPPGSLVGAATVSVVKANGVAASEVVQIAGASPGFFTANADGQGAPAAVLLRIGRDGAERYDSVVDFDPATGKFVLRPIEFGAGDDQVFLVLFGTGFRFHSSLQNVQVHVGDVPTTPFYAGAQGAFVGLDQINIPLSRSLAGRGLMDVTAWVDGRSSNTIRIHLGGAASTEAVTTSSHQSRQSGGPSAVGRAVVAPAPVQFSATTRRRQAQNSKEK